jgi:2-iminobutanoate/2-iminopropanoate deaminase
LVEVKPEHLIVGGGSTLGGGEPVLSDAVQFGDLLFLSGRAPIDPATMRVSDPSFEEQARHVLRDIEAVLAEAGSRRDLVLRVVAYLADASDFGAWNTIWCEHFAPPRPARTTVVAGFAVPGMLIELEVVAGIESA